MPNTPDDGRAHGVYASMTPEQRHERARVAALARTRPELRQQLKVAKAEAYVRELVDGFPPLSEAQRGRLAALLGSAGSPTEGDGGHTADGQS